VRTDAIPIIEHIPVTRPTLRIAVVTETYPPEVNGVAMTVARLIEGLRSRGHQIQLVRPRQPSADEAGSGFDPEQMLTGSLPIPRYPGLKMGLPAKRALARLWTRYRPDVVHTITEGPLGWSAVQAAIKFEIPVVSDFRTNFHTYSQHYRAGWLRRPILGYLRKFHNQTLCTMVPTEALRTTLTELGFRNVRVVSRGVDTALFTPARRSEALRTHWGAAADEPVILHAGRLAPEKNPALLVSAYSAIRRSSPGARLVVVGDGPSRRWLEERCPGALFTGMKMGVELAAHFASADLFLFPSLTETFGNVTIEAMASGLAVVAFDYGAAGYHIRHGANGLLAACDDPEAFERLSHDLAKDIVLARTLGRRAADTARGLDWNSVVREVESVLHAATQS
jgi:glycosyltransferase involved in cell wall biosynthesis